MNLNRCNNTTHLHFFTLRGWADGTLPEKLPAGHYCECGETRLSYALAENGIEIRAVPAEQWAGPKRDATVYNPGKSMAQVMREWDEMPDAKPHSCITQNALQSDIDKALAELDESNRKFNRDVARAQANLREAKP